MKSIEKFALALVAVWVCSVFVGPRLLLLALRSTDASHALEIFTTVFPTAKALLNIVVGYWLYREAKRLKELRWVWCLLGLVFGLTGAVFFYVYMIFQGKTEISQPSP